MTDDPTGEDRPGEEEFIDRRSGKDRRSEDERRHAGRRHRRLDVDDDRRSGKDRRGRPRRSGADRRVFQDPRYKKPRPKDEAPPVYSMEQAGQVQHALSRAGHAPTCPACGGSFTLGPVDRRGADSVRQVSCASCGRSTVVMNCILARIMVLTGVEAMSTVLTAALTGVGHEVLHPSNMGHALDLYRENPADVVIMDAYALKEMEGQELIRRLRVEFADPRIIVVARRVSYGMADPVAIAPQLGATQIVRTPFSREELLRAIKEARG
jgi:CheY-like chemotaxis protein